MRPFPLLLTAVLVLSCGSEPEPQDPGEKPGGTDTTKQCLDTSGTRLKARVGVSPDGAKVFLGWHDSARNEDCSFVLATDNKLRCLPAGRPSMGRYADANCTEPLADPGASLCGGVGPLPYIVDTRCDPARGTFTRVHQIRGKVTLSQYWVREDTGACAARSGGTTEYAVGRAAVAPEEFVELEQKLE
ncbi:MAG: hypothetical protein ACK4N5_07945 [Myxococcales bacterium]